MLRWSAVTPGGRRGVLAGGSAPVTRPARPGPAPSGSPDPRDGEHHQDHQAECDARRNDIQPEPGQVGGLALGPLGWTLWLIYPLHMLQKVIRGRGPLIHRALLAFFHVLGHFPEGVGEIKFMRDRLLGRQAQLLEYK